MVISRVSIELTLNLVAKCINICSLLTVSVVNVSGRKESYLLRNLMSGFIAVFLEARMQVM